jgi:hypothetical protein
MQIKKPYFYKSILVLKAYISYKMISEVPDSLNEDIAAIFIV